MSTQNQNAPPSESPDNVNSPPASAEFRFRNPYASADKGTTSRITVDVASSDYNLIKQLRPSQHTISGVVGTLWQKLCYELRQRNITDFSRTEDFERFVSECQLIEAGEYEQLKLDSAELNRRRALDGGTSRGLQHGPGSGAVSNPSRPDVRRRTPRARGADTTNAPKLPDVQK